MAHEKQPKGKTMYKVVILISACFVLGCEQNDDNDFADTDDNENFRVGNTENGSTSTNIASSENNENISASYELDTEHFIPYSTSSPFWEGSGSSPYKIFYTNGNVGIGTGVTDPNSRLQVGGSGITSGLANGTLRVMVYGTTTKMLLFDNNEIESVGDALHLNYYSDRNLNMVVGGGMVGIGTSSPSYKLDVIGTIRAEAIVVELGGADYVFEPEYKLSRLEDVETYIDSHHHLPGVPSATEMTKGGVSLGDNQKILLQKIEELTLYTINQNKRIKLLEKELSNIKTKGSGGEND